MPSKRITGYKFQVEAAAINAQSSLRVHYLGNRPPAPPEGYITTEWVEVVENTGVSGNFFWFEGDYAPVLGNPSEFDIDYDDEI